MGESDKHLTKEIDKRIEADNSNAKTKQQQAKPPKEEEQQSEVMHLSKKEYDALISERDQLKANLYLLGTTLKDNGFQVSDIGNSLQRLGNDISNRIRLSPEQMALIQRQIQQ